MVAAGQDSVPKFIKNIVGGHSQVGEVQNVLENDVK